MHSVWIELSRTGQLYGNPNYTQCPGSNQNECVVLTFSGPPPASSYSDLASFESSPSLSAAPTLLLSGARSASGSRSKLRLPVTYADVTHKAWSARPASRRLESQVDVAITGHGSSGRALAHLGERVKLPADVRGKYVAHTHWLSFGKADLARVHRELLTHGQVDAVVSISERFVERGRWHTVRYSRVVPIKGADVRLIP